MVILTVTERLPTLFELSLRNFVQNLEQFKVFPLQSKEALTKFLNPILDRRISGLCPLSFVRHAQGTPPMYSETGWNGELWSKTYLLTCQTNIIAYIFLLKKYIIKIFKLFF